MISLFQYPFRRYRRFYTAVVCRDSERTCQTTQRAVCSLRQTSSSEQKHFKYLKKYTKKAIKSTKAYVMGNLHGTNVRVITIIKDTRNTDTSTRFICSYGKALYFLSDCFNSNTTSWGSRFWETVITVSAVCQITVKITRPAPLWWACLWWTPSREYTFTCCIQSLCMPMGQALSVIYEELDLIHTHTERGFLEWEGLYLLKRYEEFDQIWIKDSTSLFISLVYIHSNHKYFISKWAACIYSR